jgi:hypothetical protein
MAKVSPTMPETALGGVEAMGAHGQGPDGMLADRERIMNDLANTGVIAALMGGFALSSMQVDVNTFGAGAAAPNELRKQLGLLFWFVAFAAAHLWYVAATGSNALVVRVHGVERVHCAMRHISKV